MQQIKVPNTLGSKRKDEIECHGKGFDALYGQMLLGKYNIGKFIDKGNYGSIFDVTDITQPGASNK